VKKALILTLAALTAAPIVTTADDAEARGPRYRPVPVAPAYRPARRPVVGYRPWGPVYYRRHAPVFVPAPPVVYVPAHPRTVVVRERPAPVAVAAAPTATVVAPPPVEQAPEPREFIGLGINLVGSSAEGEKVGLSTAENPTMGGIGLTFRTRFDEDFGLELSADFLGGKADNADLEQSTVPVMAGLTWHILPESRLQPYLIAGAGVHFTRLEYFGGDYNIDMTEFAGQLGGGVEFFLSENLALTADLRAQTVFKSLDTKEKIATDCLEQAGSQSGFCDNIHFTSPDDKVDLGVQLKAGVSWYF
jgi:hypothetical protein